LKEWTIKDGAKMNGMLLKLYFKFQDLVSRDEG
jgi:hypothetical protein